MKRALLTACLLSALGAPALAQTPMRLDPDGKWVPAEAPIDPASDAGVMQRARTQLAENRPRGALTLLDSWLKRNAAQDKPETAEALLRRVVRRSPHEAAAYRALAVLRLYQRRWDDARTLLAACYHRLKTK